MNELAKHAVISHVTFKFEPNGRLKVEGRLRATKAYRDAMIEAGGDPDISEIGTAITEIEKVIVELCGIGFTEAIAALAFSAGARVMREKSAKTGGDANAHLPSPNIVPERPQNNLDANQVDPGVLAKQIAYEKQRKTIERTVERRDAERIVSEAMARRAAQPPSPTVPVGPKVIQEIEELLSTSPPQKIQAIKVYRTATGAALREAKGAIEHAYDRMQRQATAAVMPIAYAEPDWARKMTRLSMVRELEKYDQVRYDQVVTVGWSRQLLVDTLAQHGFKG